jgi:hypothetical protein
MGSASSRVLDALLGWKAAHERACLEYATEDVSVLPCRPEASNRLRHVVALDTERAAFYWTTNTALWPVLTYVLLENERAT